MKRNNLIHLSTKTSRTPSLGERKFSLIGGVCTPTCKLARGHGSTKKPCPALPQQNLRASPSDLVVDTEDKIGLIYERGNDGGIYYTSFSLDWLTNGQD